MDQPKGFAQERKEHLVWKLKKTLYGLKQSPRAYYQQTNLFVIKEAFSKSQANHSLYIKQTRKYLVMVIIYVNDLIIFANHMTKIKWFKSKLDKKLDMSDLGSCNIV